MKILLIGLMGSGKDTAADYLKKKYRFYPYKLGSYIRDHVDQLFNGLSQDQIRPYYQTYGEGMRDLFGKDFWNDLVLKQMDDVLSWDINIMITDCRQQHEIDYWTAKGFVPVAIDMEESKRRLRIERRDGKNFNEEAFEHITEQRAAKIIQDIKNGNLSGYIIDNNGILEETYEQLDKLIKEINDSPFL